jgi:hypothetical protein
MNLDSVLHLVLGPLPYILGVFMAAFVLFYLLPGLRLVFELRRAIGQIRRLAQASEGQVPDLDKLRGALGSAHLQRSWDAFAESLHAQKTQNEYGEMVVSRWRSTSMAAVYFTEGTLVQNRINAEFFKNLPGILTGLGIIGTFTGLIGGLQDFGAKLDAPGADAQASQGAAMQAALQALMGHVGDAFKLSGVAIFLAMLTTFAEKLLLNSCIGQLDRLCELIDHSFEAGAGEEYMHRLVLAAETSATQALQIKDSLVTDLRQVLSELTQSQIEAFNNSQNQLSRDIVENLGAALKGPLDKLAAASEGVREEQGERVTQLMEQLMSRFTNDMQGMFGGQMSAVAEVLKSTGQTITEATNEFKVAAQKISQAGDEAAQAMMVKVEAALVEIGKQQASTNESFQAFALELRRTFEEGNEATNQATRKAVEELLDRAKESEDSHRNNLDRFNEGGQRILEGQREQVEALASKIEGLGQSVLRAVEKLASSTEQNIQGMGEGAKGLKEASEQLTTNLAAVKSATDSVATAGDKLANSSSDLASGIKSAQAVLEDQQKAREVLAEMVKTLQTTVDSAKKETGVTAELVNQLQVASTTLTTVQRQADDYLLESPRLFRRLVGLS